jgi:hypothetical protein
MNSETLFFIWAIPLPSPLDLVESSGYAGNMIEIFESKGDAGKI